MMRRGDPHRWYLTSVKQKGRGEGDFWNKKGRALPCCSLASGGTEDCWLEPNCKVKPHETANCRSKRAIDGQFSLFVICTFVPLNPLPQFCPSP